MSDMGGGSTVTHSLLRSFRACIPKLTPDLHKGQCGRIGVVGGAHDYSGAPYYVAMTGLRLGADLSHVFCTREIAPSVRAYSPDIIVHSTLDQPASATLQWLPRLHALVVGPGLGRDPDHFSTTAQIVTHAKSIHKLLVFDADSLHLLAQQRDLLHDYQHAVLTPNAMELRVLKAAADLDPSDQSEECLKALSTFYGGCTILAKGADDMICSVDHVVVNSHSAGLSRCGGQGDLLSAAVALFAFWATEAASNGKLDTSQYPPLLVATVAASTLIREISRATFDEAGRSMVASDMLANIPKCFKALFETSN